MSAATTAAGPHRLQKAIDLPPVWHHHCETTITAWGVYTGHITELQGRCAISLQIGGAGFNVAPTPDQMRAIAALLIEAADTAGAA